MIAPALPISYYLTRAQKKETKFEKKNLHHEYLNKVVHMPTQRACQITKDFNGAIKNTEASKQCFFYPRISLNEN